jgi:hypothetical protein
VNAEHHSGDGFYFRRETDGSVRVRVTAQRETTLAANEWASVVAAVSARGDDGETFRAALALHEGRA